MKARSRKTGGLVVKDKAVSESYAGKGSNVEKEAKARKSGGCVDGEKGKMRMDRAPRKSGGRIHGMPVMSAAAKGKAPKGHKVEMN